MGMMTLCMEGSKGAGKTTTLGKLAERLTQQGVLVEICAPFAAANGFAQSQGYAGAVQMIAASKAANQLEIEFILNHMALAAEQAQGKAAQTDKPLVLLYDRGWMTLFPHLAGGKWCAEVGNGDPEIRQLWRRILDEAPPTMFLHACFEITKQRRPERDVASGVESEEQLRGDITWRIAFADAHADKIALRFDTGEVPQEQVVASIYDYIATRLPISHCQTPSTEHCVI